MDDGCGGAEVCLDAIKPHYDAARDAGKAIGLGLGLKNSGLGNGFRELCRAVVRFRSDGVVEVRHGWTEMGQGVHTVALQVAAQELGIDPDRIEVIVDTTRELGFGQTTGSRGTLMAAGSVRDACMIVSIPMLGRLSSLNVSAAAALATYEIARQRRATTQQR